MSPVDHYGQMMQAAMLAARHQSAAVLCAELADQPHVPAETRRLALEGVLRETAQAEEALAEFLRLASAHAEQARTILRALAEGAGERRVSAAQWAGPKAEA